MADFTTVLEKSKPGYAFQTLAEQRVYNVGVGDEGMSGAKAVGTHNLIDIAENEAVVGGRIIIEEAFTSAGAATVAVQINSETVIAAQGKAALVAGEVMEFDLTTALIGIYAKGAAITLDWVVAVAALTAGRAIIILDVVNVDQILNRG